MDPVCQTKCPVCSIHRGDNGEMIIENWCIGCSQCANLCPYDSIQMHGGIGLIPENAPNWRWAPAASADGEAWLQPGFSARTWSKGSTPFLIGPRMQADLLRATPKPEAAGPLAYFRYEFQVTAEQLKPDKVYKMALASSDSNAEVWLNGVKQVPEKRGQFSVEPKNLRLGLNVAGVAVRIGANAKGKVLDLTLCEEKQEPRIYLVPETSRGWRFIWSAYISEPDTWRKRAFDLRSWSEGSAPH